MTFLDQEKAPLLVLQDDNDIRVPKGEAEQPNEGHGFVKRENQIDALERTLDWFDRYLKPQG
jgi:dipeptidyl aminopeptidase/acylaminoacyl peptidase